MEDELATARERRRGVDVIPERIRQARHQAGLTLADLAAGRVSAVAIHLIETGKSRPSAMTLTHIAQRTRQPIAYFTDEQAADDPPSGREQPGLDAIRHLRQAGVALSATVREPRLSAPERAALRALQVNVLESIRVLQAVHLELQRREKLGAD